jgi:hypothetical protein
MSDVYLKYFFKVTAMSRTDTVKFDSQMTTNFVITFVLPNIQSCTWAHFEEHEIGFKMAYHGISPKTVQGGKRYFLTWIKKITISKFRGKNRHT